MGLFFSTVRILFKSNTPSFAHLVKSPWIGISISKSEFNSLKIFFNDGGNLTPLLTEKANPFAWLIPWYGSWPNITIFTFSRGVNSKARKTKGYGGNTPSFCRRIFILFESKGV